MEGLNFKDGLSKKGLFILGALGLTALVLISLPKKVSIISIGNIYTGKDKEE